VGQRPMGAALLAWVRCGVEFLPAAILGFLSLSVFLLCFLFPSSSELHLHSSYWDFRVCLSGLHNNALGLRELRHGLVCITMPFVCVKLRHDLVCITMPFGCVKLRHDLVCITMPFVCVKLRHGLVCITMPLVLREILSRLDLHNNALCLPVSS
jgi:hypothetical protein